FLSGHDPGRLLRSRARLVPTTGAAPLTQDHLRALSRAALALATGGIAEITRQLCSALIDVLSSQYVRTLHAKGLSRGRILWQHGLENVSLTLLTVIGLVSKRATVAIEAVFAIPGTGRPCRDSSHEQGLSRGAGRGLRAGADRHRPQPDHRPSLFVSGPAGEQAMIAATDTRPAGRTSGLWRFILWLRSDLRAAVSLAYLLAQTSLSNFANVLARISPIEQSMDMLAPPGALHWLGTDDLGRDVFSRLIHGAPMTLYASFLAVRMGR
ncbi:MAG: hypothetical protein JWP20_2906, partial [Roseomonas sp.]|nr:hypothetical protein [Roseomonas sp.]